MDIEKAIEVLVENAARHETQLQSIRNLIEGGIKLVLTYQNDTNRKFDMLLDAQLRTEASVARLADAQGRLADAQTRTEQELRTLIESLRLPRNGHGE